MIAIGLILQICEQKTIQYDQYKDRTYIGYLTDHRWIDVVKPFNTIIVIPPYEYSLKNRDDFIDFSFLAADNFKRITTGYTARFSADDLQICTDKIIKQIHKRRFKYNQLYVFSELSIVDYLIDIKDLLRCHQLNEYIACYSKKHSAIIPEEIDLDTYQLKFASQKLDQYIKDNIDKMIIIVARDEASSALPIIVKDYLATIGSKISLLGYRDLYAVIIKNGEIFYEEINSNSVINHIWPEGTLLQSAKGNNLIINKSLEVYSAGFLVGNNAYIRLSGESIATNQRGLNIVVLDDQFNLLSRASCDTFVYDVALVEIVQ